MSLLNAAMIHIKSLGALLFVRLNMSYECFSEQAGDCKKLVSIC